MTKGRNLIFLLLLLTTICQGQADSIQARIILIGDAGALDKDTTHPVLNAVRRTTKIDNKTTILYLGDNLYHTGLPDEQHLTYSISRAVLDTQVGIVGKTGAKAYFIPGNHDWNRGHSGGWEAILREQRYIDAAGMGKNVKFYPEGGCPGPVEIEVTKDVVMVLFDSQWWIHKYEKPGIESDCPYKTKVEFLNQLQDIITRNADKLVVLACHHPFKSVGIHGGYFQIKQHIFPLTEMWPKLYIPLPGLGSIYPIARGVFGTPQDMKHPAYQNMIKDITKVTKGHTNIVYVAGHEHNLQYIRDSSYNYIVSGSASKKTRVYKNKRAPFTVAEHGFAVLEVSKNRNVDLSFITVTKDSVSRPFKDHLLNFTRNSAIDSTKVVAVPVATEFKDTVEVAANRRYDSAGGAKRTILGDNYRKEWATPVRVKAFNIAKEKGGFKIASLGGGRQTRSLRLIDKKGKEWTLRTINKDAEKAIPENLRGSLAQDIVNDMISSAHPYAPLVIHPLSEVLGVVAPSPELFFVPDDPALGIYRPMFSNTLCFLEEREPGSAPGETRSTAKVLSNLVDDNDNHVDQHSVLKARLLDMLVGDWDRHFDQWRFGVGDTGKGKLYYAMPRDRDQVFFNSDGLLIKLVSNNAMPYLRGFKNDMRRIEWLNWAARDFDKRFMNGLNEEDWKKELQNIRLKITDQVIVDAVSKLPSPVYSARGQEIIDKLKIRRDLLAAKKGMTYYKFISKEVNVVGSNKKEYFKISNAPKGLHVKVYKRNNEQDSATVMFDRVFDEAVTKRINLYGLGKEDIFEIDQDVNTRIKMRIIGGGGNDTFNIKGKAANYIYDLTHQQNYISNPRNSKLKLSSNPAVNHYDVTGHPYSFYRFPRINIGYNPEDGLMVGLGFFSRTYGFRNEPFSTQQRFSTLYAPSSGAYQIKYNGEYNHIWGSRDFLFNASYVHPVLNNFYGLGNNTEQKFDREFYRIRYNYLDAEAFLRKRVFSLVGVGLGPKFFHYWSRPDDNQNKILAQPSLVGLDSSRVYSTKTYLGAKAFILINNLNSDFLPSRGVYWNTELTSLYGAGNRSNNFASLTSDLTLYSSLSDPAKVVTVLRVGGGRILSKDFEYFQALNLGQNNFLRGFRKNRFSGSALAYGSFELRVKLFESKSYIIPGAFGLIGYEEAGRVWSRNEISKKWHNSFGGGLYFAPYNMVIVSATVGFSDEESLLNFSIGTRFNITF